MTRGFSGDPDTFVSTPELMGRMAYPSPDAWYRDAQARAAAGFPRPARRGWWRLGDVQAWAAAGGVQRLAAARASSPACGEGASPPGADAARPEVAANIYRLRRTG